MRLLSALLLALLNFSALAQHATISRVAQCGGFTREVKLSGSFLYVAEGQNLLVLSADPVRPALLGRLGFPFEVRELEVFGTTVFALVGGELHIIDASQPSAPRVISKYSSNYVDAMTLLQQSTLSGTYRFIILHPYNSYQLRAVNVTNPAAPVAAGAYNLSVEPCIRLAASSDKVFYVYYDNWNKSFFLGSEYAGFDENSLIFSGADWKSLLGSTYPIDLAFNSTAVPKQACIAFKNQGMEIRETATLTSIGFFGLPNMGVNAVTGLGSRIYANSLTGISYKELMVINAQRQLLGRVTLNTNSIYDTECIGLEVTPDNRTVYSAAGTGGLATVDVQNAAAPVVKSALVTPKTPIDIVTTGNLALVADRSQMLAIYDVTQPGSPVLKSTLRPGFTAEQIALEGHLAYIACSGNGLYIVDVSRPSQPVEVGKYQCGKRVTAVAVYLGRYACIYAENELRIIDCANPKSPVLLAQKPLAGLGKLFMNGNFLLMRKTNSIAVNDVSMLTSIVPKPDIDYAGTPSDLTADEGKVAILSVGYLRVYEMHPISGVLNPWNFTYIRNAPKAKMAQNGNMVHLLVTRPGSTTDYELWNVDISKKDASVIDNAGVVTVPPTFGYLPATPTCVQCLDGFAMVGADNQGMTVYDRKINLINPTSPMTFPGGSSIDVEWRMVTPVAGTVVLFELWNSKGFVNSLGYDWNPAGSAVKRLYIPPVPEGNDYFLRGISSWDHRIVTRNDAMLTITGGPVRLRAPNSAVWPLGRRQSVTWEANTRFAGTVLRFELWQSGRKIREMGYGWSTAGKATTSVLVTGVEPGNYRLRAISSYSPQYWDESDGWITVR